MFRDAHDRLHRRRLSEQKDELEAEEQQDDWLASQHLSYLHATDYGVDEEEDETALVDAEVAQLEEILRASEQQQPPPRTPLLPDVAAHQSTRLSAARGKSTALSAHTSTLSSSLSATTATQTALPPATAPTLSFDVHPVLASHISTWSTATLQATLDLNLAYQQSIQSSLSDIEIEFERLAEERRVLLAVYQHTWLHSYGATTSASPLLSLPRAALFTFPYLIAPPTTATISAAATTATAATSSPAAADTATATTPDCLLRTHPHRHHAVAWNEQERLALELGIQHTNQLAALRATIATLGTDAKADAVQSTIQSIQSTDASQWLAMGAEAVDWSLMAASYVPSRSAMDCRLQWTNRLDPRINHASWSEDEDSFLLRHAPSSTVKSMRHWVDVAAGMGTQRTAWQCMTRYVRTLRPVQAKETPWTEEENKRLKWLVEEEEGSKDWVRVAERMDGRTDQQCMHRYLKVLKPLEQSQLAKGVWTVAADLRLRLAVLAYGLRWSEVARLVGGGRSDVSCRERWVNVLRGGERGEQLKRGGWSKEEEAKLRSVVAQVGEVWTEVADRMAGRTDRMCRKKWRRVQTNDKKHSAKQQQQPHHTAEQAAQQPSDGGAQEEVKAVQADVDEREEAVDGIEVSVDEQTVKVEGRLRSYRKRQRNEVRQAANSSKRGRRRATVRWAATPQTATEIEEKGG